jgi:hypothetical protein
VIYQKDILLSLGHNAAYSYLDQKHNLGAAKIHNINLEALRKVLKRQKHKKTNKKKKLNRLF